jgi:hypothetical protein
MANKLNGFLDNVVNGVLNPKGNLGDFQHAARLFTDDYFRLSPKTKFLYHVVFNINPKVPNVNFDKLELNMLVKSAELPKFAFDTNVINQYNRKKIVTTKINYEPIQIGFHDDNNNTTTDMWKAYYKYMIADGNYVGVGYSEDTSGNPQGANSAFGLNPYTNAPGAYGLDYNTAGDKKRFFTSIQISQLSRHRHFTYTLINPVVVSWSHDNVASSEGGGLSESQMQVAYESVIYHNPGNIKPDTPSGFGERHYDRMPSPISAAGGGSATLFGAGGVVEGVADIFDLIGSGKAYSSLGGFLEAVVTGANTYKNFSQLNSSGLKQEGQGILTRGLQTNVSVSGLTDTSFPKTQQAPTDAQLNNNVRGNTISLTGNNVSEEELLIKSSIKKLDDFALSTVYKSEYISEVGSSDMNEIKESYQLLSESKKTEYREQALTIINQEMRAR